MIPESIMDYGLWIMNFEIWIMDFELWILRILSLLYFRWPFLLSNRNICLPSPSLKLPGPTVETVTPGLCVVPIWKRKVIKDRFRIYEYQSRRRWKDVLAFKAVDISFWARKFLQKVSSGSHLNLMKQTWLCYAINSSKV